MKNAYVVGVTEGGDGALQLDEALENAQKFNVDGIILITKAPHILLDRISDLRKLNIIIHCTITGYGYSPFGKYLESNVIHPDIAIEAYYKLIKIFDSRRIVLRIDPIIPIFPFIYNHYNVLSNAVNDNNQRVRISFLDNYKHIKNRIDDIISTNESDAIKFGKYMSVLLYNLYASNLHAPKYIRLSAYNLLKFYYGKDFEVCSEPDFKCTGCISELDYKVFGFDLPEKVEYSKQRKLCKCIIPKVELLPNRKRCIHNCLYCYWKY